MKDGDGHCPANLFDDNICSVIGFVAATTHVHGWPGVNTAMRYGARHVPTTCRLAPGEAGSPALHLDTRDKPATGLTSGGGHVHHGHPPEGPHDMCLA